ncbi:DUF2274 domain-containing protein [Xanthobacter versatilis]|uniref:DUF2274 domain-containing protein n=1 Tax=Xanthobacter autotrophicus (strain ATCC BAA-1158 / Py2) TaxID=78245 RepID=UPI003726418D
MPKLKLSEILDDKPVKVTVELPAKLHRDLLAYSEILSRESNQSPTEPSRLIVPMLERFIATDRGFAKARRAAPPVPADGQSLGSLPRREPFSGQG